MKNFATREDMIAELIPGGSVGAEIGVYRGDFSLELIKTGLSKLFLVDAWKAYDAYALDSLNATNQDANYTDTLSRLRAQIDAGRVEVIRGFSADVARKWKGPKLSWIFLDSNHAYEFVKEDLIEWSKHIAPDGFIMMHDHTDSSAGAIAMRFGVVKACRGFCEEFGWEITHHTQEADWPSCAIRRKS